MIRKILHSSFGWLPTFISPLHLITVILSEDKLTIFKGWTVLTLDYARVEDDVFGEMFFDNGWTKWIKTYITLKSISFSSSFLSILVISSATVPSSTFFVEIEVVKQYRCL